MIPGHETVGVIAAVGDKVKGFKVGDRVVADNSELCGECFYCRRGEELLCEDFQAHGVTMDGGFAEYCAYPAKRVFPIKNLSDVDATLLEPASCAAHGLDKIAPKMGSSVLMFGAGPTGLVLTQMLRQNGGCHVVVAAPEGLKMDLAKSLDAADEYVELSRKDPSAQFEQIKKDNPYGFDIVVEATGSVKILEDSINYVRRGGKLVVYGVYASRDRVSWPPSKIFGDEITILGSFSETYKFPAAIDYLGMYSIRFQLLNVWVRKRLTAMANRQGQGQGQWHREQDLQVGGVEGVPGGDEEQVCHQGCDRVRLEENCFHVRRREACQYWSWSSTRCSLKMTDKVYAQSSMMEEVTQMSYTHPDFLVDFIMCMSPSTCGGPDRGICQENPHSSSIFAYLKTRSTSRLGRRL